MSTLYIIRGLPGSGKSTTANIFRKLGIDVFAADDFFLDKDGVYKFDGTKLREAHSLCKVNTHDIMTHNLDVAVEGTFTQKWEAQPYFDLAKQYNYRVVIIDCGDGGCSDEELATRNIHNVALHKIQLMRQRWQFNIW